MGLEYIIGYIQDHQITDNLARTVAAGAESPWVIVYFTIS